MTLTAVEALSFASLTTLLASPPQYPRNPTHEVREPLVLYIVRVPGSKDVVLTPLKPPTKASISLDAIQSCLYYLHVETPEDEVVRQSLEIERQTSNENRPPTTPIQRKPLPPTTFANYPPSRRPPTPPKSYPHYQPASSNGDGQHDRYVARGNNVRFSNEHNARPLGARPMPLQQESSQSTSGTAKTAEYGRDPLKLTIPEDQTATALQQESSGSESLDSAPLSGSDSLVRITLIRRDPTSGAQWNVGCIRVGSKRHHLSPLQPVQITLSAPGYSRFADTIDGTSPLRSRAASFGSTGPSSRVKVFTRHMGFSTLPEDQRLTLKDLRTRSNEFKYEPKNGGSTKKPRQVFSFTSPWQGICIFSNGVDGKSLKLRHSLATQRSSEAEQGNAVAELRFNLPWSVLRLKEANRLSVTEPEKLPISDLLGKSKKERWRKSMQHFRQDSKELLRTLRDDNGDARERAHSLQEVPKAAPVNNVDDEYRISLRLGREKAGGGFKGDSAKLGKLILEDEGLKMGDLVVACCMGVFWQHHDGLNV